ncbi:MAG: tripartite tricarboxylate transporter substrate binding protein, partial [Betaproteobacteria bacterium]|nr:tripartite tricarboxylate transporter substrate binding protein [Betaproteobacteria bacterium]
MNPIVRSTVAGALAVLGTLGLSGATLAQFPSRPVTIIVPFAPGGGDILVREMVKPLSDRLGQPVVVETRGGAGGTVGSLFVANSEPDGYRILWHSSAAPMNQTLLKAPPVDMRRDLIPVTLAIEGLFALYATTTIPVTSLRELIDYARANPGKLNYGSSGNGGSMHMIMELVKSQAGVNIVHVPYNGGTPALAAAVANDVQVLSYDAGLAAPQVQAGKIRMLAVLSPARSERFPGVPPVAEALPGVAARYWWAFLAPKATPHPVI